ncbi:MAG TPA: DUF3016 domain-containing protein [Azonexus sp.]|nr:DUF3016 domain-containing protein [Azonexus sp.]
MNQRLFATSALALITGLLPALPAQAGVAVQFVEPQRYSDASSHGYGSDNTTLRALEGHFRTLGERCLKPGEQLDIRVLDVDLAGQPEWWHRATSDVRVMREVTWPRLDLDYIWRDGNGRVLGEAKNEHLSDMAYLWHSAYVRMDRDALPYEKWMLRDWFEERFCRRSG